MRDEMGKLEGGLKLDTPVMVEEGLTRAKWIRFVTEYCKDFNGTAAAIRAGYAENSARETASELLAKSNIKAAVERRMEAAAAVAEVDTSLVIKELYDVATADPRDLMSVTVDCCRHCHGIDHRYQWTPAEYKRELNKTVAEDKPAPDLEGGINFDPRLPPVESCPECFGRGVERVTVTPSAKLSRSAARLLASMKQSKDGIEIKTRDQDAALIAMGRVVGAFKDRSEMTGPGGGPMQLQAVAAVAVSTLSNEQLEEILREKGVPLPQQAALEVSNEQ
jgi:phage terminase small subunit